MNNNLNDIYNERKELQKQLQIINERLTNLQNQCSHKIVIAVDYHKPHKIGKIIKCICPACGYIDDLYYSHDIERSVFKDSKLIDLTELSIYTFNNYYPAILEHIFNNYEFYYNDDTLKNDIEKSILDLIMNEEQPKVKKLVNNQTKDD